MLRVGRNSVCVNDSTGKAISSLLDDCFSGKRRFQIEAGWIGRGPSTIKEYKTPGKSVCSFVIDEEEGYIIVTSNDGGMVVVDISQDRVLWSLSKVCFCLTSDSNCIASVDGKK
jgi:hypothetical protein